MELDSTSFKALKLARKQWCVLSDLVLLQLYQWLSFNSSLLLSIMLNGKVLKQHHLNQFLFGVYLQVSTWFFTTFTVSGLKDKIHYVESLQQLFTAIPPEQIDLPPFVLEYDARVSDFM